MAKGYEVNKKRQEELDLLGRELTRRSGSKCELCLASGTKLNVFEIPPSSGEPDSERCVFICGTCLSGIFEPVKLNDHWRCLNEAIWSEVKSVKILSLIILKKISSKNSWAGDIIEEVYLDEDDEEWVSSSGL
jgi:protein PhnA